MDMLLDDGIRKCTLKKILYIPELTYNLISVARAGDAEKMVHFNNSSCEFRNEKDKLIAVGAREGSLYHLRYANKSPQQLKEQRPMRPGTGGNRVWSTYECLEVQPMSIFPRTREAAESAFC